jgi:lytic murein transglycosylase
MQFINTSLNFWRRLALGLVPITLGACTTALASDDNAKIIVTNDTQRQCLSRLAAKAPRKAAFKRYTDPLKPDPSVIEKLNFQPEFISSVPAYLNAVVNDKRIAQGRAMLQRHASVLASLEKKYGVNRYVLVAVWGIETNFGQHFGSRPVLQSLATLACHGRRQAFFRNELYAAVRILDDGHVNPDRLVGSWAGAFGHTQFMPTTFLTRAIDFDGDGKRDLMENVGDALASTANYLKKFGWDDAYPWGIEVTKPNSVIAHTDSRKKTKKIDAWRKIGVKGINPANARLLASLPADLPAALIRPADTGGPVLMVLGNFNAVHAYNPSMKYSLAVNHLADRFRSDDRFVTPWPDAGKPLTRDERRELQALLLKNGHRIGKIDGVLGSRSRAAMRKERARIKATDAGGYRGLLEALRKSAS